MVGTCCALELQRRGWCVTLLDRRPPGRETSYGNAGVIARSSLAPFNQPSLWRSLPRLALNRSAGFRYRPTTLMRHPGWALGFLAQTRRATFDRTTAALDALIRLSVPEHRRLLGEAGALGRLRENGWLMVYRQEQGWDAGAPLRRLYAERAIATEALDPAGLHDLEPDLRPIFARALWVRDAASVDDPGRVVEALAGLFVKRGGSLVQADATRFVPGRGGWTIELDAGKALDADHVVVALGPWSNDLLQRSLGLALPMGYERGYHRHYGAAGATVLNRPICDTSGGYVLTPMQRGLRLTTGVEWAGRDEPPSAVQPALAEQAAREAFPLAAPLDDAPWLGSRPTLPDSRPAIGAVPRHPGLWLACGHQHIGFSTGPGSGRLLGALMAGEAPPIDELPFAPARFLR